jgi:hypothetical protein
MTGRKTAQNCLELIAKTQNKSLSEIVGPFVNQITGSILAHPFTLLPPIVQTGPSSLSLSLSLSQSKSKSKSSALDKQHYPHIGNENFKKRIRLK